MFSSLSDKLQQTFKSLRGHGRLSETNISDALREVRMALLDADVHFAVAKEFIAKVKERAMGEEVLKSVTPGQQIVKIFQDELTELLGGDASPINFGKPTRILIVGLNGAGKTTSSAKLARLLKNPGLFSTMKGETARSPLLIALDLVRPAAIDQLATLGDQIDVPVFRPDPSEKDVLAVARRAQSWCESQGGNVEIYDTAGRREIDDSLVEELVRLKELLRPQEILLVCDAATGQQAVSVAEKFHAALGLTGLILTKLDGDARGGAALSLRSVTGQPIKFAGVGEKVEQFEPFYPDRLASRILGMGDIVSLVEKAAEVVEVEEMSRLEAKMKNASFDLEDFLSQLRMIRRMGPLENLLGMIPGAANLPSLAVNGKELQRVEAIILSMTPGERKRPDILNARRRQRIARGSGNSVTEVNNLLLRFGQMKKLAKNTGKMKKMMSRFASGGMSGLSPNQPLPNRIPWQ
ncbi:MAG: signal recognition particle protein [Verrucomicrobia bacterium]|nr:signal recognition particle protein [Verrucomicrobiota bacterium]